MFVPIIFFLAQYPNRYERTGGYRDAAGGHKTNLMSATDFCRTVSDHLFAQKQVFVRAGVEGIQNTEY